MKIEFSGNRRTFLSVVAAFGGLAALFASGKPAAIKPKQTLLKSEEPSQGYRLTEHIKRYYEKARI